MDAVFYVAAVIAILATLMVITRLNRHSGTKRVQKNGPHRSQQTQHCSLLSWLIFFGQSALSKREYYCAGNQYVDQRQWQH